MWRTIRETTRKGLSACSSRLGTGGGRWRIRTVGRVPIGARDDDAMDAAGADGAEADAGGATNARRLPVLPPWR